MSRKICSECGKKSIPGLKSGIGLCQYHFNIRVFGKEWADRMLQFDQAQACQVTSDPIRDKKP